MQITAACCTSTRLRRCAPPSARAPTSNAARCSCGSAPAAGIPAAELQAALEDPDVKAQLRATTDGAHEQGVIGVPTVVIGEQLFWGDDRLEEAARAALGGSAETSGG